MTCTFFGHRDCPQTVIPKLMSVIEDLIVNKRVSCFYVGNHGQFDVNVISTLKKLQSRYPQITYYIVLAYLPSGQGKINCDGTILPEGVELVPKRYAINYRNNWMLDKSDYVVTYVTRSYVGAAKFAELADKKKKICINLA